MMPAFQSVKACPKCLGMAIRSQYLGQQEEVWTEGRPTYRGRDIVRRTCTLCSYFWDERPADYQPPTESEHANA